MLCTVAIWIRVSRSMSFSSRPLILYMSSSVIKSSSLTSLNTSEACSPSAVLSTRNKILRKRPVFKKRYIIPNMVRVLPVPVAMASRIFCWPFRIAFSAAWMAFNWYSRRFRPSLSLSRSYGISCNSWSRAAISFSRSSRMPVGLIQPLSAFGALSGCLRSRNQIPLLVSYCSK